MDALRWQLLLGRSGIDAGTLRALLSHLGTDSPADALAALSGRDAAALRVAGVPPRASQLLRDPPMAQLAEDARRVERERITLLDVTDLRYPPLLAQTRQAPALLYVRGHTEALSAPQIAVVGSRHPTGGGRHIAQAFACDLARHGLTITAGLAEGIDAAGHDGALAAGRTVAVLGTGVERVYPTAHAQLAARIEATGALVGELPPGTAPRPMHFARRNRLIAGLSLGTLVVEATEGGGPLVTARFARRYGRVVFAVPGAIDNPQARGCHQLLRQGAILVERVQDILVNLKIPVKNHVTGIEPSSASAAPHRPAALDKACKILLDALGFGPAGVDALVERTGFPSQSVASMLLKLELGGVVEVQPGGRYVRLPVG